MSNTKKYSKLTNDLNFKSTSLFAFKDSKHQYNNESGLQELEVRKIAGLLFRKEIRTSGKK